MILKELDTVPAADRFSVAGHRAEQQLAFYLMHDYYFKCGACGGNTRAQTTCETCGKSAKIRKQGLDFFADCQACGSSRPYFTNPAEDKAEAAE